MLRTRPSTGSAVCTVNAASGSHNGQCTARGFRRKEVIEMQDKIVVIRTFPTEEGDTMEETRLSVLTPEKVFEMPYAVVVGGKEIGTWDELIEECSRLPEPVEITRYSPVVGG